MGIFQPAMLVYHKGVSELIDTFGCCHRPKVLVAPRSREKGQKDCSFFFQGLEAEQKENKTSQRQVVVFFFCVCVLFCMFCLLFFFSNFPNLLMFFFEQDDIMLKKNRVKGFQFIVYRNIVPMQLQLSRDLQVARACLVQIALSNLDQLDPCVLV